jgi:hypothetical protein
MQGRSLGFHHRKIEAEKREFPKSSAQAPVSVHLKFRKENRLEWKARRNKNRIASRRRSFRGSLMLVTEAIEPVPKDCACGITAKLRKNQNLRLLSRVNKSDSTGASEQLGKL